MARENMFDSVFERPAASGESVPDPAAAGTAIPGKAVKGEDASEDAGQGGLFLIKDLAVSRPKPTTVIFSRENYIFLKNLAMKEDLNMSEVVNRWLDGLRAGTTS